MRSALSCPQMKPERLSRGQKPLSSPGKKRSLEDRISLVLAGVAKIGEMNDEIVPELAHQMGRPVRYGGEFGGFTERASYMAEIAAEALAPISVADDAAFKRMIKRVPHGVVLVVAPWNYPYMTAINTVAPALIAGNSVVLKHASQTLLVGERMAKAFHEAGVPEDVFQNVFLDHATTSALIAEKSFGFVNFTGSVGGGQAMEKAAAGTFTGVGLELGGKDPGYVMEDADLEAAVDTLIDGAMFNAGQCCCGIERIYVVESLYDAFVEKAVKIVEGYKLGNPLDPETTLGPMAHARFAAEVRAQTQEAIADGAKALIDPAKFPEDDGGAYLMPQILVDVDHSMRVMRDESFGPVVGIMKVKDDGGSHPSDERQQFRSDSIALDPECCPSGSNRRSDRDRDHFPQSSRLPRPGSLLDRLQGHRPRRRFVHYRLSQPDTSEILSPQESSIRWC